MKLFTNPNFIDNLVRSQRQQSSIDPEQYTTILTLIEIQTRLLLQSAAKFMRNDRRDTISLEDVELAARELNHSELLVASFGKQAREGVRAIEGEKRYGSAAELMEEQLRIMGRRELDGPRLCVRWAYLKGKVPNTNENISIKRELPNQNQRHQHQKRKLWNIIKDEPYSYLNQQQSEYFITICKVISNDLAPSGGIPIDGNLVSVMPFLLKFLGSAPLNESGVSFLLSLLENKYVWKSVQFGAVKSLNLLLSYRGPQSFQAGVKIAQIVQNLSEKYPVLRDIYLGQQDNNYSTILKKIPFELYLGIPLNLTQELLIRCKYDAERNDRLAILCLKALLQHSGQLRAFKKLLAQKMNTFVYWHPCADLRDDPYLKMY